MKWITLVLLLTFSNAYACEALREEGLNFYQVYNVKRAFVYGKEYDLSLTLAALIWQESSAGMQRYNPSDPSSGFFQITLDNAIKYANIKDTPANRILIAARLIKDFRLGAEYAVKNLQFWKQVHNDNWRLSVQSYNAGYNLDAGIPYLHKVIDKMDKINQCEWEE